MKKVKQYDIIKKKRGSLCGNRKKIMHIVESFGGGVFNFLVDLLNNTIDDYDIVVIYALRPQTPKNFTEYFDKRIKFIKSKYMNREIKIKQEKKAIKEIRDILEEENPNIVHLHSSKAGVLGRIAVKSNNTKIFYNPHGWAFLKTDDSALKRAVYWWVEKIMTLKKCKIIACSEGEYLEAKKLTKNSMCINNGINLEQIINETQKLSVREFDLKNPKICTIGRIGYQKNPELFNAIAETMQEAEFTWIGDGELKEKLTSKNIAITGWKDRKEVLKILNDNDIFMLTSLWEGLPISLLEAMAMKKICIVTDVIGNRDVIIDNKNGYILREKQDLINIIKNLKKETVDKITKNAYKDIEENYNTNNMIQKYKSEYEK